MGWTAPTSAFYFTSGSGVAGASGNEVPPELPDFIDSATGGAGAGAAFGGKAVGVAGTGGRGTEAVVILPRVR